VVGVFDKSNKPFFHLGAECFAGFGQNSQQLAFLRLKYTDFPKQASPFKGRVNASNAKHDYLSVSPKKCNANHSMHP
jgi:hypothetical protein